VKYFDSHALWSNVLGEYKGRLGFLAANIPYLKMLIAYACKLLPVSG
jgi:hypothetical protein